MWPGMRKRNVTGAVHAQDIADRFLNPGAYLSDLSSAVAILRIELAKLHLSPLPTP
jgi:hypothetical protein